MTRCPPESIVSPSTDALDALMQWIEKGVKPTPQTIAAGCEQLRGSLDGPCRYHPEYMPKPFATLFYPREVR